MSRTRPMMHVRVPGGAVQEMTDGGSVDLDQEVVRDSRGRRVTERDVAELVEEIQSRPRGRGGPFLSEPGGASKVIRARVPDELHAAFVARAKQEHRKESELLRAALEAYLAE